MMRVTAFGALVAAPALGVVTVYQDDAHPLGDSVRQLFDTAGVAIEVKEPKDCKDAGALGDFPLPWVFSCGAFVGGALTVTELSAAGELQKVADCEMGSAASTQAQRPGPPSRVVEAAGVLERPPTFGDAPAYHGLPAEGFPTTTHYGAPALEYGAPAVNYGADPTTTHYEYGSPAVNYGVDPTATYYGAPAVNYGAGQVSYTTTTYYSAPAVDYGMPAWDYGAAATAYAPSVPSQPLYPTHVHPGYQGYAPTPLPVDAYLQPSVGNEYRGFSAGVFGR